MYENILSAVDHTLLKQTATWPQVQALCDEAMAFGCASVCISPTFVRRAKEYVQDKLPIGTVVGFPNGCQVAQIKAAETAQAVADGAAEIDMVINLGQVKAGQWAEVLAEIALVRQQCPRQILKVIVETCFLTEEEKIKLCQIVSDSGADFIKTSTGFAAGGATLEDVRLFKAHIAPHVRIKAAGGIKSLAAAQQFLDAGASRLGASSLVGLIGDLS